MTMHYVENVPVDSGLIMICDIEYYKKINRSTPKLAKYVNSSIDYPIGKFNCNWVIDDSWNGEIKGRDELEVTSGTIVISDPCYLIVDWDKWLKDTDFGMNPPDGCILITETGGDGEFDLSLDLFKI